VPLADEVDQHEVDAAVPDLGKPSHIGAQTVDPQAISDLEAALRSVGDARLPMVIQPAEVAKLALILWCADVYARKDNVLGDWRHTLIPVLPVSATIVGLVLVGGDLGTAMVLMTILLGILWVVGAPMRLFVGSLTTVAVLALYLATTNKERLTRLTNFVNPFHDYQGAGWQAAHSILGIASGGIFGKGISASQQKWGALPEAHTDFIFAVLGEELGLIGTLLVLVLFLTIAYAGIRIAVRTKDPFVRYMSAGITIWLTVQMMINIGMVLGLLPVTVLLALLTIPLALQVSRGLEPNYDNPYGLMAVMGVNIKVHLYAGLLLLAGYLVVLIAGAVAPNLSLFIGR